MPGPTPNRRLVNFRGTKDFALVSSKGRSTRNINGIVWTSCGGTNGGAAGGGGQKYSTAFYKSERASNFQNIGEGIFTLGLFQTLTGYLAFMGVPAMAVGVVLGAYAASLKLVQFSKPCDTLNSVQNTFDEPDFNTFQQQYAAYLTDQSLNAQNANPLEKQ